MAPRQGLRSRPSKKRWPASSAVAILPRKKRLNAPNLRDRLYELLEHDQLPYSLGSRFAQLIVCIIIIDVLAMVLASVPEFDARFGTLFTAIKVGAAIVFALEYAARLWSVAGHSPRKLSPAQDRIEYALSSLGIIDLLAFLPASIALIAGQRSLLVLSGVLPFFKLVRYSPAMRSLLAAFHAERRTLVGCLVILTGAVLVFASLLHAIEHDVQPEKFGTIPAAMWWAIVTLGTVGYGDVVPVTPRDAGYGRLWRRRSGYAIGQGSVGVHHRRRLDHDCVAGGDHLDRICRRGEAARFRRHLGHAGAGAAVLASERR